jgi:hypothetical protein
VKEKAVDKKPERKKVMVEANLDAVDTMCLCAEKIGPKKAVIAIFAWCLRNTLEKCYFPVSMFATKEDEEKAGVASVLFYVKNHWDELYKKGLKELAKKKAEVEKAAYEHRGT